MSSLTGVQATWVTFVNAETDETVSREDTQMPSVPRNSEYVVIDGKRYVVSGAEWNLDGPAPAVDVWVVPR